MAGVGGKSIGNGLYHTNYLSGTLPIDEYPFRFVVCISITLVAVRTVYIYIAPAAACRIVSASSEVTHPSPLTSAVASVSASHGRLPTAICSAILKGL